MSEIGVVTNFFSASMSAGCAVRTETQRTAARTERLPADAKLVPNFLEALELLTNRREAHLVFEGQLKRLLGLNQLAHFVLQTKHNNVRTVKAISVQAAKQTTMTLWQGQARQQNCNFKQAAGTNLESGQRGVEEVERVLDLLVIEIACTNRDKR
jgi:hypothetical protein